MRVQTYLKPWFCLCFLVLIASGCTSIQANLEIAPATVTLEVGESQQFTAFGTRVGALHWFVNGIEGGNTTDGTISSSGLYTAPPVPPSRNAVAISAVANGKSPAFFAYATIVNPAPALSSLNPTTTISTSDIQLVLNGSGFTVQSGVTTGGTALTSTLAGNSQLTVTVPASLVSTPGQFTVTVTNPGPGGGSVSTVLTVFPVGTVTSTNHPQVARYSFNSPFDATVTIEFGTDTSYGLKTWTRPVPVGGGPVDILVAGMRGFTTYHMRAIVQLQDGTTHNDVDHIFTTGGLDPSLLPNITVTQSNTLTPTAGVQLLNLIGGNPKVRAVVTDLQGNVIWYYDGLTGFPFPMKLLPNGNFLILEGQSALGGGLLREIDLAGNTVREIATAPIAQQMIANNQESLVSAVHHDFAILPNGHLVLLTSFGRQLTNVPGALGQTVEVVADGLVELDANLNVLWTWNSFDHLDLSRQRIVSPSPPAPFDWTHGNALVYDPADGNLLLSLRNQHWVLKLDYRDGLGTGNILFRIGNEGELTLTNGGPPDWQYGQHYPFLVDNQQVVYRVAVFDNGNDRQLDTSGTICGASSGVACYSRAVIFDLDEGHSTAHLNWEQRLPLFAPFIGSIQVFPTGQVLYDAGTINGTTNATMREVTQDLTPQTVWQMDVAGQFVYRGIRLPSLYPGVQW